MPARIRRELLTAAQRAELLALPTVQAGFRKKIGGPASFPEKLLEREGWSTEAFFIGSPR
jgi:hypothetical protein